MTTENTEYLVQAMSLSTGSSGRWVAVGHPTPNRRYAEKIAAERSQTNGRRVAYRVVSRTVPPWVVVTSGQPAAGAVA